MKKFDINAAKMGNPVCMKNGNDVTIFKFDMINKQPIVGVITLIDGSEEVSAWSPDGYFFLDGQSSVNDLMMK